LEADRIGLFLMAQAGYDPEEAPRFWQRFAALQVDLKPPEFLSTHPADARRAADLRALLPEARKRYADAREKRGLGDTILAANSGSGAEAPLQADGSRAAASQPRQAITTQQ